MTATRRHRSIPGTIAAAAFLAMLLPPAHGSEEPSFVGSEACADCHVEQADLWLRSHHAQAWMLPSENTVLGAFDDRTFSHLNVTSRFSRDGETYRVETDGPDGTVQSFDVVGVAGVEPLQQYLVETESGRIQALDTSWDVDAGRWYHLYPGQDLKAGDGLHWTGPYKSWNARCAECHATGFEKRYDHPSKRYQSTQAEIGVGCEACHGPASDHLAWARGETNTNDQTKGFSLRFDAGAPEKEIQQCAGCHSRREPFFDGNPPPGTPFHDAYRLAVLRPGLYHADGSILEEVYVYGSFLQSKMYANGVRCSNCHEPHSGALRASGNAVCTQCHSPGGNTGFPSLTKTSYDDPSHHFHPANGEAGQCVSCHMIERTYMGIDGRRDHSFRVPRPDLSTRTNSPNACTDCHTDRSADWAAKALETWYPASRHRGDHPATILAEGRLDPVGSFEDLVALATDTSRPNIVRASALDLLKPVAATRSASATADLLNDPSPLVRGHAVALQRHARMRERASALLPLLGDPSRLVRVEAAKIFMTLPISRLPRDAQGAGRAAVREWRQTLDNKLDYPETHMVIGGAALTLRDLRTATRAFETVVEMDPNLIRAWSILVEIHEALGDPASAKDALNRAVAANPEDLDLRLMQLDRQR